MKISLCMIVKNEEEYIKMCLENALKLADEAIIVDTGSEDKTIEIIKQFGDRVKLFNYKWNNDFSAARNVSLKYATGDWILMLDADEKLLCNPEEVRNKLEKSEMDGYEIPLYNIVSRETVVYSAVYCKLFRNVGYKYSGAIHEQIDVSDDKTAKIEENICKVIHYGYICYNVKQKDKTKRNLGILLSEKEKNPNNPFVYYNIGVCYEVDGEYNKALENFFKCNELAKAVDEYSITKYEIDMIKRMAECYYGIKEYKLCVNFITDVLKDKMFDKFVDLYFILGNCYFILKDYDNALAAMKKCIDIGETSEFISIKGRGSYQSKLLMARIYAEMERVSDSVMQYIEAVFDTNNFMKFGLNEAREYMKKNNYIEVLDQFDKLVCNKN